MHQKEKAQGRRGFAGGPWCGRKRALTTLCLLPLLTELSVWPEHRTNLDSAVGSGREGPGWWESAQPEPFLMQAECPSFPTVPYSWENSQPPCPAVLAPLRFCFFLPTRTTDPRHRPSLQARTTSSPISGHSSSLHQSSRAASFLVRYTPG